MTTRRSFALRTSLLAVSALSLACCAGNEPYRTKDLSGYVTPFQSCNAKYYEERGFMDVCDFSYYSTYRHRDERGSYDFDLAFVEFTERGAVFDQDRMEDVIGKISGLAASETGVTTVVYVHGWKNNASAANGNVRSFREMLAKTAMLQHKLSKNTVAKPRKLVGLYIGWRGSSLEVEPFHQLSYWDRKTVAEEVGKGGVTELLLRLERILRDESDNQEKRGGAPNKNLYLVTGHSLGAAVLLTGLNEFFMERIIDKTNGDGCVDPTDSFGHGVALLNPAIETSEILELKQLVGRNCFHENQERMMHIISSDADKATTGIFEVAQWLGLVIGWNQARFERSFVLRDENDAVRKDENDEEEKVTIKFDEAKMDMTTVGNYEPFLTGYLFAKNSKKAERYGLIECPEDGDCTIPRDDDCVIQAGDDKLWNYVPFKRRKECFFKVTENDDHVPISNHEPLAFIKTDENFIGDHNDVFNENVAAYLATIVAENRFIRARRLGNKAETLKAIEEGPPACFHKGAADNDNERGFNFGLCFDAYHQEFCGLVDDDESDFGRHETCTRHAAKSRS